jgi:hypothetical protein
MYENWGYYKGKPLYNVGYNIHYPAEGEIKGTIVNIYGGYQKTELDKMYLPGQFNSLDHYLMQQHNMAVVTLNLPDLLELDTFQFNMPKDLVFDILNGISRFVSILIDSPKRILQNKPVTSKYQKALEEIALNKIYLHGQSFGGLLTLLYAEYGNDYDNLKLKKFDGYILGGGALSFDFDCNTARKQLIVDSTIYKTLKIDEKGQKKEFWSNKDVQANLREDIFIYHNFDDNNANIKNSTTYAKQILDNGGWINVCFNNKGPITSKSSNKGHGLPDQKTIFDNMGEVIAKFMFYGTTTIKAITQYRVDRMDVLADKNHPSTSIEQKFISEIYRKYINYSPVKAKQDIEKNWDTYTKLFNAMTQLANIKTNEELETINRCVDRSSQLPQSLESRLQLIPDENIKKYVYPNINFGNKLLIPVKSAFGGTALYKLSSIPSYCKYNGTHPTGEEKCEHVDFHKCIGNAGGKIYINTKFINDG